MSDNEDSWKNILEDDSRGTDVHEKTAPRDIKIIVEFLIVVSILATLMAIVLPAVRSAKGPARSLQCRNNMKSIIRALHNYSIRNDGMLPPAYTVDANGRRLHSWRTLILNDLDQRDLAARIDFTKPWDDPVNAAYCDTYVSVYSCPEHERGSNFTPYLAVVGPNSFLHPTEPRALSSLTDAGNTIGVIDMGASKAVSWMSPNDADEHMVLSLGKSIPFAHTEGTNVAFADGSVGFLPETTSISERHSMTSLIDE